MPETHPLPDETPNCLKLLLGKYFSLTSHASAAREGVRIFGGHNESGNDEESDA